jgi:hypothetical protein
MIDLLLEKGASFRRLSLEEAHFMIESLTQDNFPFGKLCFYL